MKKLFICLILVYSMLLTACPKTADIQKAKSESARIASYANLGVNLTRELLEANLISIGVKDKIADGFIVLAKSGQAFDLLVKNAEAQYGAAVPKSEIAKIFATFDREVITQFLAILSQLKIASISEKYVAIIESFKAAILVIGAVFNMKSAVKARLSGV